MKKLFTITVLMALTMSGVAQILHYDFSAVCETGQTLYYLITSEEEHTVTLTYPYSEENELFAGNYYEFFTKPEGEIVLPSIVAHNGIDYTITAIDRNAFTDCEGLIGVLDIPDGVISIGQWAFDDCSFSSIRIPASVSFIAPSPFTYCEFIDSIVVDDGNPIYYSENNSIIRREDKALIVGCKTTTIPDDVEIICSHAFFGAGDGGNLIIPNSVKTIEEYAFTDCWFSGSIVLSEALETIGRDAFSGGFFSGSLTIPDSVTEMGHDAFSNCQYLTGTLTLPSSLSSIDANTFYNTRFTGTLFIPNSVKSIGGGAFCWNNFSELVLGDSLVTIVDAAFENCYSLTGTLRLPSTVTQIGSWAFCHTSFNEIYSPNTIPPTLGLNVFYEYDPNLPIHIPFGCTEVYQNAEGWNYFSNFIETEMNLEGEWYYEILNDDGSITYQHLECVGDTLIGREGKRPKVIVRSNTHYLRDTITEVTHEYVYEENGMVYWWNKDLQEFTTLYNLNAIVGDEWEIKVGTESLTMHVDAVENYEYERQIYRMLRVSDPENLFSGNIVCSIGHLTNFFPERLMNRGRGYRVEGMRCYWINGDLTFKIGDEDCDAIYAELHNSIEGSTDEAVFAVYPNPADGVLFVETFPETSLPDHTYRITNTMGQTVLSGNITAETQQINIECLPKGMYFITIAGKTQKFIVE